MDKIKELREERDRLRDRLSEIWEEEQDLEMKGLDLPGKYMYNNFKEIYIHITSAWLTGGQGDRHIILEGETVGFFSSEDTCYFTWERWDQIEEPFLRSAPGFMEMWKEITEGEWKETKEKALKSLMEEYWR